MIKTLTLQPGITLRCFTDSRFKTNCLSVQLVRPMCRQEAAANALIPAVLLRMLPVKPVTTSLQNRCGTICCEMKTMSSTMR